MVLGDPWLPYCTLNGYVITAANAAWRSRRSDPSPRFRLSGLHRKYARRSWHTRHLCQLGAFFDAICQHGWDASLSVTVAIHAEDYLKHGQRPLRALSKTPWQLEDLANLDCRRRGVGGGHPGEGSAVGAGALMDCYRTRDHAAARADDQLVWRPVRVASDVPSLATSAPMRWYRGPNSLGRVSMT